MGKIYTVFVLLLLSIFAEATSDCYDLCAKKANSYEASESSYGFDNQQQRTNYIGSCVTSCQRSPERHNTLSVMFGSPAVTDSQNTSNTQSIGAVRADPTDIKDSFDDLTDEQKKDVGKSGKSISQAPSTPQEEQPQAEQQAPQQQEQAGPPSSVPDQNLNLSGYETTTSISLCTAAKSAADSACNSDSQSWMKAINQVSSMIGSQMNQGACSAMAAAQTGSAASISLFTVQCGQAVNACIVECQKSITDPQSQAMATDAVKSCRAKGITAKETEQAAAKGIQQIAQAVQSCKTAFGMDMGNLGSQTQAYVGKSTEDILAGLQTKQDQGLSYEGTGSGLTGDMNASLDLSGLVDDTPAVGGPAKPRVAGDAPGGQQGSAGLGSGGGVGVDANSGKSSNRRGGGGGLLSNILSGFFGGGGGGLFGGSGRSGGGSGSGNWFGGGSSSLEANSKTPDLRQFLPGGKFDPKKDRGIAGRIVSSDGMSGPHQNIWRMVNNRYQYKKASLLP